MGWPLTATWAVGLLIGVNLIFRGMAIIASSLALRRGLDVATDERLSLS